MLERSLVSPERFAAAMRRWATEDPRPRGSTQRDVGERFYLAYARRLERLGRVDRDLFAWRALDELRAAPGRWWGERCGVLYGFDDLHPTRAVDAVEDARQRVVGVEVPGLR